MAGTSSAFVGELGLALGAALIGGLIARRLKLPPLIGYLGAGIAVGPNTPGLIADRETVQSVADLGVALLMFTVGVQFHKDALLAVKKTALIGGLVQIFGTIALGIGLGIALGFGVYGGVFFGCALALSSTAVTVRILDERGEGSSQHGTILLGFLVVQDLALLPMAALLPSLSQLGARGLGAFTDVGTALLKAGVFLAGLFLVARLLPRVIGRIVDTGSRELFLLAAVALCLGTGWAADTLGLGLALGAFLGGILISETAYAKEVHALIRPLRDLFAALFFVSIGMLLNPRFVWENPVPVLSTVALIVVGKAAATALALKLLGWSRSTIVFVSLGLAQIGEFSFVLASLGSARGLIDEKIGAVLLSAALVTLLLSPLLWRIAARVAARQPAVDGSGALAESGASGEA